VTQLPADKRKPEVSTVSVIDTAVSTRNRRPDTDDELPRFLSVKQVAEYLQLNEKKVYALISEGKIPATKVTGKWLFPRDLVDQWLLASSHGGVLTDRMVLTGSDDPLIHRATMLLANEVQAQSLVSYACTGTQLGLALLARRRADICGMHWGPADESRRRHPALIRQYAQHHDWVLVRGFYREQGLIVSPELAANSDSVESLSATNVRWAMRQEGGGSHRFLGETLARYHIDPSTLRITARAYSEREAASLVAMEHADVAPGIRAAASEFGLEFLAIGWEAYDFALYRGVYFRTLFQKLLQHLQGAECQRLAQLLGGYDFSDSGQLVWSE
jgi:putative molybdopterin biosynthesis protein